MQFVFVPNSGQGLYGFLKKKEIHWQRENNGDTSAFQRTALGTWLKEKNKRVDEQTSCGKSVVLESNLSQIDIFTEIS